MSGSTIGGVVGAAIGFYFGGPQGAQWGWMIGSAIGGYVDPEKIKGPQLTDAMTQTSRDGVPITQGEGTFKTAGNLIWQQPGPPTPHSSKKRQGKGGPEVESFTYTRSFAIGVCRGILRDDGLYDPIAGFLMVKHNGKLVYDARPDDVLLALGMTTAQLSMSRAASAAFLQKVRFYTGGEGQLPDPTIEAWKGAGNALGYPGLAYLVGIDFDVTALQGAIGQFEFVVSTVGTEGESTVGADVAALSNTGSFSFGSGTEWPGPYESPPGSVDRIAYIDGVLVGYNNGILGAYYSLDRGATWTALSTAIQSETPVARISAAKWVMVDNTDIYTSNNGVGWTAAAINGGTYGSLVCIGGHRDLVVTGDNAGRVKRSTDMAVGFTTPALTVLGTAKITAVSRSENEIHNVVIANQNGGMAYWDTNTQTWIGITTPFAGEVTAIYYANFTYVAVSPVSGIAYSENGINWTLATAPGISPRDVTYTSGLWVVGGGGSGNPAIATSPDAITWTLATELFNGDYIHSVAGVPCSGTAIPDAPGWYVEPDGSLCGPTGAPLAPGKIVLGEFVAKIFKRWGLSTSQYDVSQLTDLIDGYRYTLDGTGADAILAPTMQGYFYDIADWDGKLHCVKRGGPSLFTITDDDLAERDGEAVEWETIQDSELLRKVTVGAFVPEANYEITTQDYERRAGTILAQGEQSIGLPITIDSTALKRIAEKRVNVGWAEREKAKFCLPVKFSRITATDPGTYIDRNGRAHRIRAMDKQEEGGVLMFEAPRDRQEAYVGTVTGVAPNQPTFPGAALIGPTQLVVMNLPVLREADDAVGLYVAGRGYFSGWNGGQVQVSTDSGASYSGAAEITQASTIGYTATTFAAGSAEITDTQSLTVRLPDAPESVDYATLLRYSNRAAIQSDGGAWEVMQFQTVTSLGDGFYTLSGGIIRGRYGTTPGAAAAGATFVLIDSSLQFVRAERWMIGQTLQVRAVSYGTDPDAAGAQSVNFTTAASQTEWRPFMVAATRDGSNNVTVTGYVRARLGVDTSPYHSAYFAGARVTYSDGNTYDVTPNSTGYFTHTRSSTPASQTIAVSALNSITGAGPASTGITV